VSAANLLTLVRELYDAFARQDLSAALARRHPDVEIRQTELVPRGGHYRGHEGAREFFGRMLGAIDSAVTVERFIDAGDHVAAVGRMRGRTRAGGVAFDLAVQEALASR
jgi:ketosteroid isomerase-like protein